MDYIIPTWNNKDTLRVTLESIKKYGKPDRIIVVDHASTDGTRQIVEEFGCVIIDTPVTLGFARYMGAQEAKTEYVAFVDSDTELLPSWQEMLDYKFPSDIGVISAFIEGSPLYGRTLPLKLLKGHGTFGCTITQRDLLLGFPEIRNYSAGEDIAFSRYLNSKGLYWYCLNVLIEHHRKDSPAKWRWYGAGIRKVDGFQLSFVKRVAGGAVLGINQRDNKDTYLQNWKVRMDYLLGYLFPNKYFQIDHDKMG